MNARSFAVAFAFASVALIAGCAGGPPARTVPSCPVVAILPHADVELATPLGAVGRYAIEIEADGAHESCALEIHHIVPGQRVCRSPGDCVLELPMSEADTTCRGAQVLGYNG